MALVINLLVALFLLTALVHAGNVRQVKKSPKTPLKYNKEELKDPLEIDVPSTLQETTDIRFLYQCLDQHNKYRKTSEDDESTDNLMRISSQVEKIARRRALKLAGSGKITVDSSVIKSLSADDLAENVAFTALPKVNASDVEYINCRPIVDLWYSQAYGIERESVPVETDEAMNIRARSQTRKLSNSNLRSLIWTQANELGCAQVLSVDEKNPGIYTLCNYRRVEG